MTFLLAVLIYAPAFGSAAAPREEPPVKNRWEKLLEDKKLTAKQRAAYEQLAKLHTVKLLQWDDRGSLRMPSFDPESKVPTDVLHRMGVDALPALAVALDDETPTETVFTDIRTGIRMTKVWKVNELAARLVWLITDRDFVIGEPGKEISVREIALHPKLASEFRKQVIAWHEKFASKTLTERKLADASDPWFRNRFDAVIWLGENRAKEGRKPIAARVDAFYADEKREVDSTTRSEMSYCSFALGQIGDKQSLPQVRRVCKEMSWRLETYGVGDSGMIDDLFRSYRGLIMLGKHEEAIKELTRLFDACGPKMDETRKKEFEKGLKYAKGF